MRRRDLDMQELKKVGEGRDAEAVQLQEDLGER